MKSYPRKEGEWRSHYIERVVRESRRDQGMPPKVTDVATLARVSEMLRAQEGD